jgi:D-alanine-D-alanine ligase
MSGEATMTTQGSSPSGSTSVETLDITVLAGGPGVEREVSLESGAKVGEALTRVGHRATVRDISPDDLAALDVPADMVFLALHGAFGEDGTVQRILDQRGIPYCGSGADSSALAMDKVRTKVKFGDAGIPTPPYEVVNRESLAKAIETMRLPVFVKPCGSGSSVDVHIIRDGEELGRVLPDVIDRYGTALVEDLVDGPELTVGVLGGESLPVCQIRTRREFYDYNAKYVDDDTEYLFDVDLPDELLRRVQELSLVAHDAVGCRDFCRVDWMVDARSQEPYAIEINTIPGLTSHSLLPKAASRAGVTFDEMCQRIVGYTMRRVNG